MTTPTLPEFLLARFDDDEALAKAASPGPWHVNSESDEVLAVDDIAVCDGFALSGPQTRATTAHIARHDPARVLAEVAAKRAIVEDEHFDGRSGEHVAPFCSCCSDDENLVYLPCPTLRFLASVYSDHADYREEWKV